MQISIRKYIYTIILTVIIFSIGQLVYSLVKTSPCELKLGSRTGSRCIDLFKDSVKQEMKCYFELENTESDICAYNFHDKYRYVVWRLGEFRNINMEGIKFCRTSNNMKLDANPTQEFELGVGPSLYVKDVICFSMHEELNVLTASTINVDTISKNYCIASSSSNEIIFANRYSENQILISTNTFHY